MFILENFEWIEFAIKTYFGSTEMEYSPSIHDVF